MLTREEIVALAKAYSDQSDTVKEIEWRARKVEELEEEYRHKASAARSELARAKAELARAEETIFKLELKNGHFKTKGT